LAGYEGESPHIAQPYGAARGYEKKYSRLANVSLLLTPLFDELFSGMKFPP
jgi:hypothetical protein